MRDKRKNLVVKKLADRMDTLFSAWGSSVPAVEAAAPVTDVDIDIHAGKTETTTTSKTGDKVLKRSSQKQLNNAKNNNTNKKRRRKIEKAQNSGSIVELRLAKAEAKLHRKKLAKTLWE